MWGTYIHTALSASNVQVVWVEIDKSSGICDVGLVRVSKAKSIII